LIGLETAFGLTVAELIGQGVISLPLAVEKLSGAPARIMGLVNKGVIAEGKDADLVIVDVNEAWTLKKDEIASKSKNTPFLGRPLKGRVKVTVCNGKIVYQS
jgi:dihydroorotase